MKHVMIFSLIVLLPLVHSCRRKYGCMDSVAENYDIQADYEDYSCYYILDFEFRWTTSQNNNWYSGGTDSLFFYIDNDLVEVHEIVSGLGDTVYVNRTIYDEPEELFILVVNQDEGVIYSDVKDISLFNSPVKIGL